MKAAMNKLAVVTGATGSIGRGIVDRLVVDGYHIVACGMNREKLVALRDAYTSRFITVCPFGFLYIKRNLLEHYLNPFLVPHRHHVDLLVCAHGAAPCTKPTLEVTQDEFDAIYATDVMGSFLMAQVIGAFMAAAQAGSIVFVSSAHAHQTYPARVPYAAAKAAICGMARALAVEWGPYNIRVNVVVPWQVYNDRTEQIAEQECLTSGVDTIELYRQRSPLRRCVKSDDIAETVLFLAKNTSMTGQEIRIDCGVGASMWHRGFLGTGTEGTQG